MSREEGGSEMRKYAGNRFAGFSLEQKIIDFIRRNACPIASASFMGYIVFQVRLKQCDMLLCYPTNFYCFPHSLKEEKVGNLY